MPIINIKSKVGDFTQFAISMNQLLDDCKSFIPQDVPNSFYHYTSLEGLRGIVTNKNHWFTDYRFLNDPDEGSVVHEVFTDVANDM